MRNLRSDQLRHTDIPKSRDRDAVCEFAATFDGYRLFGEGWGDALGRLRRAWAEHHCLPWDLDTLRAWLALEVRTEVFVELDDVLTVMEPSGKVVHQADPKRTTVAGARHELLKAAIVDRVRALVRARECGVNAPTADRPIRTLIPRTPMLERYLNVKESNQPPRVKHAVRDREHPERLVADFLESVEMFSQYDNRDEAFHDPRKDPVASAALWETDDVSARLLESGLSVTSSNERLRARDLGFDYVGREIFAARTKETKPTHRMQRVELVRHDLLLCSRNGGLPVVGEVKTPTDEDPYYALIQVLAAASQLVTPHQAERLRRQHPEAHFVAAEEDRRVDVALLFVNPERCNHAWQPTKTAQRYRSSLEAAAPRLASTLVGQDGIGQFVRRIILVRLALVDGEMRGEADWVYEAIAT